MFDCLVGGMFAVSHSQLQCVGRQGSAGSRTEVFLTRMDCLEENGEASRQDMSGH